MDKGLITLKIYDANDEVRAEYSTAIVRWGLLKKAIILQNQIDADHPENAIDAIAAYLVEVFNGGLTVRDLEDADVGDVLNTFFEIIGRATAFADNLNFRKGRA